jgi:glycosyltransferase involved in cell wall biosynthesis
VGDTMYWDQSYRESLEAMIVRLQLGALCRLQPHTTDPFGAFCSHHVFCIASHDEPFGRVVAEAQAYGLPVIGFAEGGITEIVEHGVTGLLAPAGNVAAFASAMELFIDKKENVRIMGSAAQSRASAFFNRDIQTKKIVDRIEQTIVT